MKDVIFIEGLEVFIETFPEGRFWVARCPSTEVRGISRRIYRAVAFCLETKAKVFAGYAEKDSPNDL